MMKEERVLFPYVVRTEASASRMYPCSYHPFGTVANPVHDDVGARSSWRAVEGDSRTQLKLCSTPPMAA